MYDSKLIPAYNDLHENYNDEHADIFIRGMKKVLASFGIDNIDLKQKEMIIILSKCICCKKIRWIFKNKNDKGYNQKMCRKCYSSVKKILGKQERHWSNPVPF